MSVDLFIQHAKRIDRIILSSVACLALAYFSTSCYKQPPVSGNKGLLNIKYDLIFSTICLKYFSF